MYIVYEGGPRGLHALTQALEDEGVEVVYTSPIEQRGAGQTAVQVAITVVGGAASGLAADALKAAVKKAIAKVRERDPELKAEVEEE